MVFSLEAPRLMQFPSSLRYVHNFFSGHHKTTVGVDFHLKQLIVNDKTVRLQLWDIAGQDRFSAINKVYYKDAVGAFLVYDLSRSTTFDGVAKWKEEIDSKVFLPNNQPIPVVLLANKNDLENVTVDANKLDAYCKEHNYAGWFDTSAKTNVNIDKAAKFLVEHILQDPNAYEKKKSTVKVCAVCSCLHDDANHPFLAPISIDC
jgi:Ras-related protein Rab-32